MKYVCARGGTTLTWSHTIWQSNQKPTLEKFYEKQDITKSFSYVWSNGVIEPGEPRWFDVTVYNQNAINLQIRQQMPTMLKNNTASSFECSHGLVLFRL